MVETKDLWGLPQPDLVVTKVQLVQLVQLADKVQEDHKDQPAQRVLLQPVVVVTKVLKDLLEE